MDMEEHMQESGKGVEHLQDRKGGRLRAEYVPEASGYDRTPAPIFFTFMGVFMFAGRRSF
jgi:hypothetical protein